MSRLGTQTQHLIGSILKVYQPNFKIGLRLSYALHRLAIKHMCNA